MICEGIIFIKFLPLRCNSICCAELVEILHKSHTKEFDETGDLFVIPAVNLECDEESFIVVTAVDFTVAATKGWCGDGTG